MEYFGLKLQTLRKKASMSQDDLATLIGVSRQAISKWERSDGLPDLYNVKKIAEVFNITIDELMDIEIKPIDKDKIKTNKLALTFLTVNCIFIVLFSIIIIAWFVSSIFSTNNTLITITLFVLLIISSYLSLFALYGYYNLRIGRKVNKYRIISLILNSLGLGVGMYFLIISSGDLVSLAISLLILIVGILGLLASIIFENESSLDQTVEYLNKTKLYRKILITACLLIFILYLFIIFRLGIIFWIASVIGTIFWGALIIREQ
jgi:transcriptional regulator with XRE-family HTH domain